MLEIFRVGSAVADETEPAFVRGKRIQIVDTNENCPAKMEDMM